MKKLLCTLLLSVVAVAASAQRRSTVSGVVADVETRQIIIGVVVELAPASDSTKSTTVVSGAGGAFSTGAIREPHIVKASLLGYEPLRTTVDITEARQKLDTLFLQQGIQIDAVVKRGVAMRTSMAGDTLIYNADAYKVAADANVSGLLEKMPGIKVDGGAVTAQGESVKKVLIDNREYFGEDVAAAISSLPAEAVKSIEVFDKLSDNAEFTGIDDGEGYKAINITTRASMRQGVMGQVSALYGAEPPERKGEKWHHYGLVGGNVNIFQGDAKITVGGTLNNLNERRFTSDDILGAGDDDGIARVGRFQLNYIDELGKRNQWKVDASYSYGITDSEAHTIVDREYFERDDARFRNYYSDSRRDVVNRNHSFHSRIDWKPNQYHELRIRPFVRFQGSDSHGDSNETYIPVPVNGVAQPGIDLNNWSRRDESGYMMGLSANYRVRLGKPGRTLSMFFNTSYDPDDRHGTSMSMRQNGTKIQQSTPSFNYDFNIGGGLTYTEPVSKNSLVNLDYSIRYNYSDQDRRAYLWNDLLDAYEANPDTDLSGVYNSGYTIHRVGPGYRRQKGKNTLSAGVFYQYSTLDSSREMPLPGGDFNADFNNITYSAMLNTQFTSGASIRVFLNSMTRNPGVFDLQDVPDISNVQNISRGNLDLKPSYNNMLYARFIIPSVEKGQTLSFNLGGRLTSGAIVRRTIRESPGFPIHDSDGVQLTGSDGQPMTLDAVGSYSEPVNMDGQWSARFGIDYGFPVRFLRSNLNLEAEIEYNESPSQRGKWSGGAVTDVVWSTNYSRQLSPELGINLGSNISEKIDFRIGYDLSYNQVRNTYFVGSDNEYLRHDLDVNFKFLLPAWFTVSGNAEYRYYKSVSGQAFRQEYLIANAGIGKKVLRSRQGEVSVFVNDIFNQNVSFRRLASDQYIQNQTDLAIGRYVGVKFAWNIRRFGKNGSRNMDLYKSGDDFRGGEFHGRGPGGPGGPPPGGFHGRPF
jgi:hypothetical protein